MYKQLSDEQKSNILVLSAEGLSTRSIAERVGYSHSTVVRWLRRNADLGSMKRKKGNGPKRKTSEADDRILIRRSLQDRRKTAVELAAEMSATNSINIGVHTVRRRLRAAGLVARRPAKKPLLTQRMKRARLEWARRHLNWTCEDWRRVLWSDESKFNISGSDGIAYVRRRKGERFSESCVSSTTRVTASQMVWGCFSYYGVGHLHFIVGTVNGEKYRTILEENMVPSLEEHFGREADVIFQDDSAPCHRSKLVKKYLSDIGVQTMDWPGNSPDLNPIENLWRRMKVLVASYRPTSIPDLQKKLERVWYEEISAEEIRNLVDSMPKRVREVIKANGGATKY